MPGRPCSAFFVRLRGSAPLCAIMRAHGAYNCANSPPVCPLARQIGLCLTRTKFALRTLIVLKLFRNRVPLAKGDERGFSKQGGYPPCVPKRDERGHMSCPSGDRAPCFPLMAARGLRRETRLATLFILKYYSALRAPLLASEATLCGRFSLAENRNFGSWHA